ncbi:hypothetical protein [Escherichia marmotae]|uniref:hypothetical protein n=1 Tax=Escherichia marmotae TaxID=1499973 RepID=UPI00164FEDDF|nr:hypothetical protein [Escherichia marmotae]MED0063790.1 hypothetical protein [Escherichia marmotae]
MKQLGVPANPSGYKILTGHLTDVAGNPSNIANRFSKVIDGKDVQFVTKDSLFSGPGGKFAQFESTWQVLDNGSLRLTTVIPTL